MIRLLYLLHATSLPAYEWDDPDNYGRRALALARYGEGWRWSFDSVRHSVDGRDYSLPPLYPTFLSLFALLPGFPFTAQVGQIVLAAVAIGCVFVLGTRLHSERAGLIASSITAVWLPSVIAVWSTMQEALYVPLVLLGFVLLLRADARGSGFWGFALAGLAFSLATLTRSMPLYFMPFVAFFLWNAKRAAGLLTGFVSLTVPYSVLLSLHLGEVTFVENHAAIRILQRYGESQGDTPPGVLETASTLARALVGSPGDVVTNSWDTLQSVFHVNGGRLLQIYLGAATKTGAIVSKIAAHVFADGLLLGTLLLAPFGFVLCRRRRPATFLVSWIVLNLGLIVISGFGGPRLRAPFEPHAVALAAVPLAGGYGSVTRWVRAAAFAVSAVLAGILLPQAPASLAARGDYGVEWRLGGPPKRSPMMGAAGFNVLSVGDTIEFGVRPRNQAGNTAVDVTLEGRWRERVVIFETERWFRYEWPGPGLVYVELEAKDASSERPVRMLVIVPAR